MSAKETVRLLDGDTEEVVAQWEGSPTPSAGSFVRIAEDRRYAVLVVSYDKLTGVVRCLVRRVMP